MNKTPGIFIGVAGPSGAGKDSLMDAARAELAGDNSVHFTRRIITRPAESGGEDHHHVSEETFESLRDSGAFAFTWEAHGLRYGLPAEIDEWIAQGDRIVANISRNIIPDIRERYPNCRFLIVDADPHILAERLAKRGRESVEEIEARLRRRTADIPHGPDIIEIDNSGDLAESSRHFTAAIIAP